MIDILRIYITIIIALTVLYITVWEINIGGVIGIFIWGLIVEYLRSLV